MIRRSCIETLESRLLLAANPANQIPIQMIDGFPIATITWQGQQVQAVAGQWMVKLDGYSGYLPDQQKRAAAEVQRTDPTFSVTRFIADGLFLVNGPQQMLPAEAEARLSRVPGFSSFVPDFRYEMAATPNDPFFGNQWGLHNFGQFGGTNNVDIDAPEAWNINTGSSNIAIGIVDSGVDYDHPDLAPNMWVNAGEIPGNGIDDDGNGYIDDVYGYDFVFNTSNPMDDSDHGTHVAGIAAARGNNGIGISGVSWNSKIIALKAGSGLSIFNSAAVASMYYIHNLKTRPNNPVDVRAVNHSYGGPGFDPNMNFILLHHNAAGIMNVAAAGNQGSNNDLAPRYPASYQQPNVLAVANHTNTNVLELGSNFGANSVHLAAPGTNILSTIRTSFGSYTYFDGTSMAAPMVAGAVAVLSSAAPTASLTTIKNAIMQGVDLGTAYQGRTISGGRLNLARSLSFLAVPAQLAAPDMTAASDTGISSVDNITRITTPTFQGFATAGQLVKLYANGVLVGQVTPATNIYSVTSSALTHGVYDFTVTATNTAGEGPHSPPLQVTIDTVAPVPTGQFRYHDSPHSYRVTWSEQVGHSIADADFGVINTGTSASIAHSASHDNSTHITTLAFPDNTLLDDGRFRTTVFSSGPGGGVTDVAGNPMAANVELNFLFMLGDADNDGRVNLTDFNILAANFGQSQRDYSEGDFNYDGVVNLTDFNILASKFGQVLASEPSASPFGSTNRIGMGSGGGKTLASDEDPLGTMLA